MHATPTKMISRELAIPQSSLVCQLLLLLCFIYPQAAYATMIVVVVDKDGFWVGSDSLRGLGAGQIASVCKIHPTPYGVVAKDGRFDGVAANGKQYSLDKELRTLIESTHSAPEFKSLVQETYTNDLWNEAAFNVHQPQATAQQISNQYFLTPIGDEVKHAYDRSVVLLSVVQGRPTVSHLLIYPESRADVFGFKYFMSSPFSPGSPGWMNLGGAMVRDRRDLAHRSLYQFGLYVGYERSNEWILSHPEEAIREVLAIATKQFPKTVGGPFSILRATYKPVGTLNSALQPKVEIRWISKGRCPSWTDSISIQP